MIRILITLHLLINSNQKNQKSLSTFVFIGVYKDWKKVNGTPLILTNIDLLKIDNNKY